MRRCLFLLLPLALGLLFTAGPGWGAPSPQSLSRASDDPFAGLQDSLFRAADAAATPAPAVARSASSPLSALASSGNRLVSHEDLEEEFAKRYWRGREKGLRLALERLAALRPMIETILRQEGVPAELIAVVLVESAARADAMSRKGARGLWQFVPATAERYGLAVRGNADERLDVLLATQAAAKYLSDLNRRFGDWQLTLAAYNAGEQAIQQAILRAGTANFETLSARKLLPDETRIYVHAVLDAVRLLRGREASRWEARQPANPPKGAVVFVSAKFADDVGTIVGIAGERSELDGRGTSWTTRSH
jgi:soluble lytic murein transglycosylase-like protein